MPRRKSIKGFTLTELLVVIAIIGVLIAISIPAVMVARNTANKAACANNLKDLGVAVTEYHSRKEHYPPSLYTVTTSTGANVRLNWVVTLLPDLDQLNLFDQIADDPTTFASASVKLDKLICPLDDTSGNGPLSYAANCGRLDSYAPDFQGTGIFYDRALSNIRVDAGDVYDGTASTILIAENSDATSWKSTAEHEIGVVWFETNELSDADISSGNYVGFGQRFNETPKLLPIIQYARPAGFHAGTVNVLFCDGSVQAIQREIDYKIYCQLMTADSRKVTAASRGNGNPPQGSY